MPNSSETVPGSNDLGRRKEDHDWVARLFGWFVKFHWLATIFFAFFLMLGFGFQTPAAAFAEIRGLIARDKVVDSIAVRSLTDRMDKGEVERRQIKELIEALVIIKCQEDLAVSQNRRLPCRRLYREWGLE